MRTWNVSLPDSRDDDAKPEVVWYRAWTKRLAHTPAVYVGSSVQEAG